MRLVEIFLNETTEEDRALISLSQTLYQHLSKYNDIEIKDGEPKIVGSIGDMVDTPLELLNPIQIMFVSNKDMLDTFPSGKPKNKDEEDERNIFGYWDPESNLIALNADYRQSHSLKSAMTHELRHALDDYKSNFKASKSTKYSTPKNPEHRIDYSDDPYASPLVKKTPYYAKPEEINARFAEVLHGVMAQIKIAADKGLYDKMRPKAMHALKHFLDKRHIEYLFPEREKSRAYKRLIKRAVDMIDKEIEHIQSQNKKK